MLRPGLLPPSSAPPRPLTGASLHARPHASAASASIAAPTGAGGVERPVTPPFRWGQSKYYVWLVLDLPPPLRIRDTDIHAFVNPSGDLWFSARTPGPSPLCYELGLSLYARIVVEDSLWELRGDSYYFQLKKSKLHRWPGLTYLSGLPEQHQQQAAAGTRALDSHGNPLSRDSRSDLSSDRGTASDQGGLSDLEQDLEEEEERGSYFPSFMTTQSMRLPVKHLRRWKRVLVQAIPYFTVWDLLFANILYISIITAMFTKVEESFNVQAAHDLLYHGLNISAYDHLQFPGVVPRTFVGPLVLALMSSPVVLPLRLLRVQKVLSLVFVRFALATIGAWRVTQFRKEVSKRFGHGVGVVFMALCATQFHFTFYLGRPLPNTFALLGVIWAYEQWFREHYPKMVVIFTVTSVIFRGEVAVLFGPILLIALVRQRMKLHHAIGYGLVSALGALCTTVLLDSFFWQRWLWPEGEVMLFNVWHNRSHEYGVSPWHWYFSSALLRAAPAILLPLVAGIYFHFTKLWPLMAPCVVYLAVFSALPHKELRFILYLFPLLNVLAAMGFYTLFDRRSTSRRSRRQSRWLLLLIGVGALFSAFALRVSSLNYPGGDALFELHQLERRHQDLPHYVHLDEAVCQTGVSRFGEWNSPVWRYSKQEGPLTDYTAFTHLIHWVEGNAPPAGFHLLRQISGFHAIDWLHLPPRVISQPKVAIWERDDFPAS